MVQFSASTAVVLGFGVVLLVAGTVGLVADVGSEPPVAEAPASTDDEANLTQPTDDTGNDTEEGIDPPEEPYIEAVPERGDPYFEAEASDGSWISYINPRDEYRDPYLGDGSGKLCVSLYNADGEVVVGETVPNTTVTVPTGDSLDWHSHADPFVVEFPLTEQYERPLDADQFGTDPDLPQGDGYLDSHCMEIHGMPSDGTIEYGEATIDGEYADRIELVGYIQQDAQSWDSDVDPLTDARSYEAAGGGWTYDPEHSHGQMVVVLQLDQPEPDEAGADDTGTDDTGHDDSATDETQSTDDSVTESNDPDGADGDDSLAGFGVLVAVVAVLVVVLGARSW